jgi:hypothetical protein
MKSLWTQTAMKQIANQIAAMLNRNGLPCKAVRQPCREYLISDPRGLIEHARLQFLESGDLACIARGFRMEDSPHSPSKFASAILGRAGGDMTAYGFKRLESRSTRPF